MRFIIILALVALILFPAVCILHCASGDGFLGGKSAGRVAGMNALIDNPL
ncbi:MAG: hypothetical protein WCL39_07780 [Armatimonadota bacterium]